MARLVLLALEVESSPEALPLGAACVVAALRAAFTRRDGGGHEVSIVDGIAGEPAEAIAKVLSLRPDFLGLSVYAWNRGAMAGVAAACRAAIPGLVVFAGGPEATADPLDLIEEAGLDFVVRGEGESASVTAIRAILDAGGLEAASAALASLPGIALPGDRATRRIAGRPPAERLELLVSPWLSGSLAPKEGGVLWELARGCPYRCVYCYEGKGERGIRRVPRERIEAELEFFVRSGVGQAFVLDPTFDADREAAKSLLDLFARGARDIHFKFEVRAELLDRALARKFAALSCSLQVGLQSADPEVSAACGRPLDLKAFSKGIGHLNEAGVVFGIDLIYGLPTDSLRGFRHSLDYALGLQPNHLDVFPLAVLPGTELAERASEWGLEADKRAPYILRSSLSFSARDMEKAAALAQACDFFYSRGRAVSWFLQVLKPLGMKPSAFLAGFADFLAASAVPKETINAPAGDHLVEEAQLAFIAKAYRDKGLGALEAAARDVVRFNGAWGRALADGVSTDLDLSYDPDEVLGPEALDLVAFSRRARPRPGRWRLVPGPSGPSLEKRRR